MGQSIKGSRSAERGVEGGWLVDTVQDVSDLLDEWLMIEQLSRVKQ